MNANTSLTIIICAHISGGVYLMTHDFPVIGFLMAMGAFAWTVKRTS